jgi:hypothetical protein
MPSTSTADSTAASTETTPAASSFHDYCTPALSTEEKLEAAQKEIARLQEDFASHRARGFFLERFGSDPTLILTFTLGLKILLH